MQVNTRYLHRFHPYARGRNGNDPVSTAFSLALRADFWEESGFGVCDTASTCLSGIQSVLVRSSCWRRRRPGCLGTTTSAPRICCWASCGSRRASRPMSSRDVYGRTPGRNETDVITWRSAFPEPGVTRGTAGPVPDPGARRPPRARRGCGIVDGSAAGGVPRPGSGSGENRAAGGGGRSWRSTSQATSRAGPRRPRAEPRRDWARRSRGSRGPPARPRSHAKHRAGRAPRPIS